jgi:hypothetical protein
MSKDTYRFEPVEQNAAGHAVNARVCAVYKLEGFIHRSYRNDPEAEPGRPYWEYFRRGGEVTGLRSEASLEALQAAIAGEPPPSPSAGPEAPEDRPVLRLYIGLLRRDGGTTEADTALALLEKHLEAFTATETTGWFDGRRIPTLVVAHAAGDPAKVRKLAADLCLLLDQDGIGLETGGRYERVTLPAAAELARRDRETLRRFARELKKGKSAAEMDAELFAWWWNRY